MATSDIQVKELEKRASGQAFELILGPRSKEAAPEFPLSPPKKEGSVIGRNSEETGSSRRETQVS